MESVIAIAIISICVIIAVMVFVNVTNSGKSITYHKAINEVETILNKDIQDNTFLDETFNFKGCKINKKVSDYKGSGENLKEVIFTISIGKKVFKEKRLIYVNEMHK